MKDTLLWTVCLLLGGLIVAQQDGAFRHARNQSTNYRSDLRSKLVRSELVRYRQSREGVRLATDQIRAEVLAQRAAVLQQTREIQNELREATRRGR